MVSVLLLALGVYLAALVLLFVVGDLLSKRALRAAAAGPSGRIAEASPAEKRVLALYRRVIAAAGLTYYASVPLMFVFTLLLGAATIYVLHKGHAPRHLKGLAFFAFGGILVILVQSLRARREEEDPGVELDLRREPRFAALLDEVAREVGAPPVEAVFLVPEATAAVFERRRSYGRTQRCLVLGVGILEGMSVVALKSVLAHEHGHLKNNDTDGGGRLALAVRASIDHMLGEFHSEGHAHWYNPAWWSLRAFRVVYFRITRGATRLKEVLADRWAAQAYGSEAFAAGMHHMIGRAVRFPAHVGAAIEEAIESDGRLLNVYQARPAALAAAETDRELRALVEAAIDREPGPYDSHPTPRRRLTWMAALAAPGRPQRDDREPAWGLFKDRQGLEERMSKEVRNQVAVSLNVVLKP